MTDWTSGYVADINYTYGYYSELNPNRLKLSFLNAGIVFPEIKTACELGFGQGLSANIHAAASTVQFFGTDFNPAQAGFARELSAISGSGAKLYDDAFADFCMREDIPDFDLISLHGIWSWISDDNRKIIVDFVRRKLKVGGVFYISYNTQPGWAAMIPMRHLLTLHADVMGVSGHGIVNRIDSSLEFAFRLLDMNPLFLRANPAVAERLKKIKEQNRNYLAHEYFNKDWHPMHFADMSHSLAPAKLSFACSSHYFDYVDALNLLPEQQTFMNDIPDPLFRETVRDFMTNQQFRRDYWVKGLRKLTPLEQVESFREHRIILVSAANDIEFKVSGFLGEVTLNESIYRPVIEFLSDYRPKSIGQIEQAVSRNNITFQQLLQVVMLLVGKGDVASAHDENISSNAKNTTGRLNSYIIQKSRSNADICYLASPVTGGGLIVNRFHQLFILARSQGRKTPEEWVQFVWQILSSQGQLILKDGRTLQTVEENIAELRFQASEFVEKKFPVLKATGIV